MSKKDGGPAFPVVGAPGAPEDYPGMTLRDYFAAKAMVATIEVTSSGEHAAGSVAGISGGDPMTTERRIAADAYAMADAMIAERGV